MGIYIKEESDVKNLIPDTGSVSNYDKFNPYYISKNPVCKDALLVDQTNLEADCNMPAYADSSTKNLPNDIWSLVLGNRFLTIVTREVIFNKPEYSNSFKCYVKLTAVSAGQYVIYINRMMTSGKPNLIEWAGWQKIVLI